MIIDIEDYDDDMPGLLSLSEVSSANEDMLCDTGDTVAVIVHSDDYEGDIPELLSSSEALLSEEEGPL